MKVSLQWQKDCFYPFDAESVELCQKIPDNKIFPSVNIIDKEKLLDYKAVFWIWAKHRVTQMEAKNHGKPIFIQVEEGAEAERLKDKHIHDVWCERFLGYTKGRRIGSTVIRPSLRTLTYPRELTPEEWYIFLRRIEEGELELGYSIPIDPRPSKYSVTKKEREGTD